jgi:hypothetical protein
LHQVIRITRLQVDVINGITHFKSLILNPLAVVPK